MAYFREAQNCRDKKTLIFFFAFPLLSGKLGKQSLRFRAAITFFFGITFFLYQNENLDHMIHGRQFYTSQRDSVRGHPVLGWPLQQLETKFWKIENALFRISWMTNSFKYTHRCLYRPYSLVPDPQISRNCEAFAVPRWRQLSKKCLDDRLSCTRCTTRNRAPRGQTGMPPPPMQSSLVPGHFD